MGTFSRLLLLLIPLLAQADPRQVYTEASPAWLAAVGKLSVPSLKYEEGERAHYREHCTATLVSPEHILSGWHCIEYYRDLSMEIVFDLPNTSPPQTRVARRVADGGGMDADWLLLRLDKPVDKVLVTPLSVSERGPAEPGPLPLLAAGFSRDPGLGSNGRQLSYHEGCHVLANEWYRVATDCLAYKGASGGPVILGNEIIGVVSSGDSRQLSYYTPSTSFAGTLKRYLQLKTALRDSSAETRD